MGTSHQCGPWKTLSSTVLKAFRYQLIATTFRVCIEPSGRSTPAFLQFQLTPFLQRPCWLQYAVTSGGCISLDWQPPLFSILHLCYARITPVWMGTSGGLLGESSFRRYFMGKQGGMVFRFVDIFSWTLREYGISMYFCITSEWVIEAFGPLLKSCSLFKMMSCNSLK